MWLLDDPSVNAASFGEGMFVLWAGLGTLTDEQLDAVFAHEFAHDRLQHSKKSAELRDVTDFIGEAIGAFGGRDETTTQTLKRWSGRFVVPRYDRQQELEADADAVAILTIRRYSDPAAVVCGAFVHLRSMVGEGGGGFFDSYPAFTERIQALRARFPTRATEMACR